MRYRRARSDAGGGEQGHRATASKSSSQGVMRDMYDSVPTYNDEDIGIRAFQVKQGQRGRARDGAHPPRARADVGAAHTRRDRGARVGPRRAVGLRRARTSGTTCTSASSRMRDVIKILTLGEPAAGATRATASTSSREVEAIVDAQRAPVRGSRAEEQPQGSPSRLVTALAASRRRLRAQRG